MALFDGRDPDKYTRADEHKALEFLNLFHAALYVEREAHPCGRCRGSGLEPRVAPPLVAVAPIVAIPRFDWTG